MTQAVEDGATRPVYYESRVIRPKLDEATLKLIDTEYDIMANNADPEVIEKSSENLGRWRLSLKRSDHSVPRGRYPRPLRELPSRPADRQSDDCCLFPRYCHEDL